MNNDEGGTGGNLSSFVSSEKQVYLQMQVSTICIYVICPRLISSLTDLFCLSSCENWSFRWSSVCRSAHRDRDRSSSYRSDRPMASRSFCSNRDNSVLLPLLLLLLLLLMLREDYTRRSSVSISFWH